AGWKCLTLTSTPSTAAIKIDPSPHGATPKQQKTAYGDWSVTGVQTCALPISMGETVGRILTAARSRNGHRRHAVGRHGVAHVGARNFAGDAACTDERDVGGPFDGGTRL